jgi:hypothetical protein
MGMSQYQNTGRIHNLLAANKFFQNVAKFKYLETTVTNENCIHKEIKSKLNWGILATILFRFCCFPVYL